MTNLKWLGRFFGAVKYNEEQDIRAGSLPHCLLLFHVAKPSAQHLKFPSI